MAKNYIDLKLPTESADNYYLNRTKSQVDDFIYIQKEWYEKIFEPTTYYILGAKGSGKTLYAAYMCACMRKNTISKSHTIDVSDYGKLIAMKIANHLDFTDYLTMWKVILLQKFLLGIDASEIAFWGRTKNFAIVQKTISDYFGYDVTDNSFNPITVIDSCEKQTEVTKYLNNQTELNAAVAPFEGSAVRGNSTQRKGIEKNGISTEQTELIYTDVWLRAIDAAKKAVSQISFKHSHYLFIDGLDVRPNEIDAKEYGECIGALVRAIFDLNSKVFGSMSRKDECDFKIIGLTRTDIFLNSNLVNVTSCINDNCVELDWTYSNEKEFRTSQLYKMMNRVLGWDGTSVSMPSDTYLGFTMPYPKNRPLKADLYIQRQSRLRPRDIVKLLQLLQEQCKKKRMKNPSVSLLNSPNLISTYSNYYTDQVKSEMMFKYSAETIKKIFELVKMINADTFTEANFEKIYRQYCDSNTGFSSVFSGHRAMLDVLYTLDLVGWTEALRDHRNTHWHYREVKAIDEMGRLPWERFDTARDAKLVIHNGASKHILGVAMR